MEWKLGTFLNYLPRKYAWKQKINDFTHKNRVPCKRAAKDVLHTRIYEKTQARKMYFRNTKYTVLMKNSILMQNNT